MLRMRRNLLVLSEQSDVQLNPRRPRRLGAFARRALLAGNRGAANQSRKPVLKFQDVLTGRHPIPLDGSNELQRRRSPRTTALARLTGAFVNPDLRLHGPIDARIGAND